MSADDKNNLQLMTSAIIYNWGPGDWQQIFVAIMLAKHSRNKQQYDSAHAVSVSQDDMCDLELLTDLKHSKPVCTLFSYQMCH